MKALAVAVRPDPETAVTRAVLANVPAGSLCRVAVQHDDGCPCLHGRPISACTCEIVHLRIEAA